MTSIRVERGRSGGVPSWALPVLALVLVAGFMAWLAVTAEPSNPGGAGDGTAGGDTLAARAADVPAIDVTGFAQNPAQYEGAEIRLASVPVDSRLGTRAFWLKLPNQGLYLVRGTTRNTADAQPGQSVTVAGSILPMGDSVVTAWIGEGSIAAEQEMEARYATSFMDAWYIAPSSSQQQGAAASAAQE